MFIEELQSELRNLPKGTREGARKWPYTYLLKWVTEAASLGSSKKAGKNWSVVTSMLVGVYKDEMAKMRAIAMHNMSVEAGTVEPDDDDSDETISPNPFAGSMDRLIEAQKNGTRNR